LRPILIFRFSPKNQDPCHWKYIFRLDLNIDFLVKYIGFLTEDFWFDHCFTSRSLKACKNNITFFEQYIPGMFFSKHLVFVRPTFTSNFIVCPWTGLTTILTGKFVMKKNKSSAYGELENPNAIQTTPAYNVHFLQVFS
jgi:hypothetical protein